MINVEYKVGNDSYFYFQLAFLASRERNRPLVFRYTDDSNSEIMTIEKVSDCEYYINADVKTFLSHSLFTFTRLNVIKRYLRNDCYKKFLEYKRYKLFDKLNLNCHVMLTYKELMSFSIMNCYPELNNILTEKFGSDWYLDKRVIFKFYD
jgi:hypothetical protein